MSTRPRGLVVATEVTVTEMAVAAVAADQMRLQAAADARGARLRRFRCRTPAHPEPGIETRAQRGRRPVAAVSPSDGAVQRRVP